MLGKASAIKARNQVSVHPPLSKLAGLFVLAKVQQISDSTNYIIVFTQKTNGFLRISKKVLTFAVLVCKQNEYRGTVYQDMYRALRFYTNLGTFVPYLMGS